jgi:predicted N-formylglutamate amidohydrolase
MGLTTIISCEHAGNLVPIAYRYLFDGADEVLESHRGWDLGAEGVAVSLAAKLQAPLHCCYTTRLLVEPNRSIGQPDHFSTYTQALSAAQKNELLHAYYHPYRKKVIQDIRQREKPVLHLSIHSFTPIWNGVERAVDIGLLFDPERKLETTCITRLKETLESLLTGYQIKFNAPYRGIDDGFTTYLRTQFADERYAGIEIEINQKFAGSDRMAAIVEALTRSISSLLD